MTLLVNMYKRKDALIQKGNKCLSGDDIARRILFSTWIGAVLLLLRIAAFGLPRMSDRLLERPILIISGVIMYWPLYIVASAIVLIICGFVQKRRIEKEIKILKKEIDEFAGNC